MMLIPLPGEGTILFLLLVRNLILIQYNDMRFDRLDAQKLVHRYVEQIRKQRQKRDVRAADVVFPLADRLRGDADLFGELFLGETLFFSQCGNALAERFFVFHESFLLLSMAKA